jgi:diaminopimelate epimerase
MKIKVFHMSGAGNKFSVINAVDYYFSINQLAKLAPILCTKSMDNPYYSEGLISVETGVKGLDFSAEFLNPDGSHGAMCGNGGRCAVYFASNQKIFNYQNKFIDFSMAGNTYKASINQDNTISLNFPPPILIIDPKELKLKIDILNVGYVNVGSDHAVIDFKDLNKDYNLDSFNIMNFSPEIRFHSDFQPLGVNVNVYEVINNIVFLRTFERGVEAETGACGTGAISTALIASKKYNLDFPVRLIPTSKEEIQVDIIGSKNNIAGLVLTGPAIILDSYDIDISEDLIN